MGKVNFRYYHGRKKPWRAQWTEGGAGKKAKSRTKWFRSYRGTPPPTFDLYGFAEMGADGVWLKELAFPEEEWRKTDALRAAWEQWRAIPEKAAALFKFEHEKEGLQYGALAMTEGDRARWWKIAQDCAAVKMTPEEVVAHGLKAVRELVARSETLESAIGLWKLDATSRQLRPTTIKNITYAAKTFAKGRAESLVSDFNGSSVKLWVSSNYIDQDSRDSMLARLLTFFRWCCCEPRFWGRKEKFEAVRWEYKVISDKKRVSYYSSREAEALLNAAPDNLKPALALGFFAGVRPFELNRILLSWTDPDDHEVYGFKEAEGVWEISAKWAKTRRYRKLYALPDCWAYWWLAYKDAIRVSPNNRGKSKLVGKLVPMNYRNFRKAMSETHWRAGIKRQPKDGIRHSFGTHGYHISPSVNRRGEVKIERGVEWTIALMGHTGGLKVFQNHYEGKVSADEAEAYFSIYPAGAACDVKTRARVLIEQDAFGTFVIEPLVELELG